MSRTSLADHWGQYRVQRSRQVAKQTLASETSDCVRFVKAWDRTRRSPKSMDADWVEEYLFGADGIAGCLQPASYNKAIAHLRSFVTWLVRRTLVSSEVLDALTTLKAGGRKQFPRLDLTQMEDIVEAAEDPWERFVISLGFQTLGRWGELQGVQRKHVHLDRGRIEWWREKTDENDQLPITRQLDTELRRWITAYEAEVGPLEPDHYMIPRRQWTKRGWQLIPSRSSNRAIISAVKKLTAPHLGGLDAIKGQGVHILRRSAARELYEALKRAGVADPIRIVMAMLGHKRVTTTELYIGVERDRETRDMLLAGASLLSVDRSNTVDMQQWKVVHSGG